MAYDPPHSDETTDDNQASAALVVLINENAADTAEDRAPRVTFAWTEAEGVDRPDYGTAAADIIPNQVFLGPLWPAARTVGTAKLRIAYASTASVDVSVLIAGEEVVTATLSSTGSITTIVLSAELDVRLPTSDALPEVPILLRVLTATIGDGFRPYGGALVGVGDSHVASAQDARAIDAAMTSETLLGSMTDLWRLYRDYRQTFTVQPAEHAEDGQGVSSGNQVHVGALVARRPDTLGVRIVMNVHPSLPDAETTLRAEWFNLTDVSQGFDTQTRSLRYSSIAAPASDADLYYPSELEGASQAVFELPWPSGSSNGDVLGVTVTGSLRMCSAASVTEWYPQRMPRSVSSGASVGDNVPARFQAMNAPPRVVRSLQPILGGDSDSDGYDYSERALAANDRRLRATRMPVVFSRYYGAQAPVSHVDTVSTASPPEVFVKSMPFKTVPSGTGKLDITGWLEKVSSFKVAVYDTGGSLVTSTALSPTGTGREELTGAITGLSSDTWYLLDLTLTATAASPGNDETGKCIGVLITETEQSTPA